MGVLTGAFNVNNPTDDSVVGGIAVPGPGNEGINSPPALPSRGSNLANPANNLFPLSITGGPDFTGTMTLVAMAPSGSTLFAPLTIHPHPAAEIPLVIGRTRVASGNLDFYIDGVAGAGGGAADYQGYATLAVPSTTNGTYKDQTFPLTVVPHKIGSGISTANLFASGFAPTLVKAATLATSGSTVSAPGFINNNTEKGGNTVNLHISSRDLQTSSMDLYMDKDFNCSNNISLYINHRMGSGHLTTMTRGADLINNNIPLSIKPPHSGALTLYVRGYDS
tara:strand:+ start:33669 stop:34505 length:837 start_codon:yes stop_codon:yes gene_type:complete